MRALVSIVVGGIAACGLLVPACNSPSTASPKTPAPSERADAATGSLDGAIKPAPSVVAAVKTEKDLEYARLTNPLGMAVTLDALPHAGWKKLPDARAGGLPAFREARMFAMAFDYGAYGNCYDAVNDDGTLCPSLVLPGVALSAEQVARVTAMLRASPAKHPKGELFPHNCAFSPRHTILFYGESGAPVAEATICFECGDLLVRPSPPGHSGRKNMKKDEAEFFLNLCREVGPGGCPRTTEHTFEDEITLNPLGASQPSHLDVTQAILEISHGVDDTRKMNDLEPLERRKLCAWLGRVGSSFTRVPLTCQDGRSFTVRGYPSCLEPSQPCEATVGEMAACIRGRLGHFCEAEPPTCARALACKWGVVDVPRR